MELRSAFRWTLQSLSGAFSGGRLRDLESLNGFAARGERITACVTVFAALQARFGSFEECAGFDQLLSRDALGARIARSADRLSRIAHLLYGRAGASG
jgi:hypothetical protein